MTEKRDGEWNSTSQSSEELNNSEISISRSERFKSRKESSTSSNSITPLKLSKIESSDNAERLASERSDEVELKPGAAPIWLRSLFWVLRKSVAPIIMLMMLLAGLFIGYVIMGGQPKEEVFEWSTYKHMWDLIFAES